MLDAAVDCIARTIKLACCGIDEAADCCDPLVTPSQEMLMRVLICMAVVGLFTARATGGQIVPTGSVAQPGDKEIVDLVGGPMSQVFAKFSFPDTVEVSGAKSKTPKVRLFYGSRFAFEVRDKKVVSCIFLNAWKGPLLGFKMSDATDDIEKKLGKPRQKITNPDGWGLIFWDLDSQRQLKVIFDSDHKCTRVDVETK